MWDASVPCGLLLAKPLSSAAPINAPDKSLPAGDIVVQQHLSLLSETLLEADQDDFKVEICLWAIHLPTWAEIVLHRTCSHHAGLAYLWFIFSRRGWEEDLKERVGC